MHLGYEKYYDPNTWGLPRHTIAEYAIKKAVDKCNEQRQDFLALEGLQYLKEDVQDDYDERVELIKGMLRHYFYNIAPKVDTGWTPVKVEIGFMVPIPHPDTKEIIWCRCPQCKEKWDKHVDKLAAQIEAEAAAKSRELAEQRAAQRQVEHQFYEAGIDTRAVEPAIITMQGVYDLGTIWKAKEAFQGLPVVYAGRVDALFVDNEGSYWIADWKSTRTVNVDHDEFLELDDQISSYVMSLRKLGLPVRGFIYHEQKKGYPQRPNENKFRRLGRLFSISQNQDTDYDTYLKTVQEEDTEAYEAGLYDEFLEYLKTEGIVFFKRWQVHKSDYQNEQTEYNIGLEALDIIDQGLRIYPSPGRFGCTSCAFRQPCLEQNAGGDYPYMLDTLYERREHYYVRTEPSTETRGGL